MTDEVSKKKLRVGDIVYSMFFNSDLIIVQIKSNIDWMFVIKNELQKGVMKAQAPLSHFASKEL